MIVSVGATGVSVDVQIVDDSGLPVTGLAAPSFPAVAYSLAGANADVAVSLSDLATITTAWSSGGVKERGNGVYRLDLPNATFTVAGEIKVRGESSGKHLLAPWIDVGPAVVVASYAANQDPATQVLGGAVPGTWPSGTVGYVLGKLSPTALTLVRPITAGGAISVVQGCDYRAVDGYALDQTLSSSLPGLSGAGTPIVALFTGPRAAAPFAYVTGNSILGAGTATQKLRMEPTAAQTAALALGSFYYRATIPLVDGNVIEIATSTFQVTLF